nr:hypothetical protein Iba_chr12dCG7760 [Ipomoea batatas]
MAGEFAVEESVANTTGAARYRCLPLLLLRALGAAVHSPHLSQSRFREQHIADQASRSRAPLTEQTSPFRRRRSKDRPAAAASRRSFPSLPPLPAPATELDATVRKGARRNRARRSSRVSRRETTAAVHRRRSFPPLPPLPAPATELDATVRKRARRNRARRSSRVSRRETTAAVHRRRSFPPLPPLPAPATELERRLPQLQAYNRFALVHKPCLFPGFMHLSVNM